MKMKNYVLTILLLAFTCVIYAQNYRVKSIQAETMNHSTNTMVSSKTTLVYTNENLTEITVSDEKGNSVYRLSQKKQEYSFVSGQKELHNLKFDKNGNIEKVHDKFSLKYNDDNTIKELVISHSYLKTKEEYDLLYDESNNLRVAARNKKDPFSNYLFYSNSLNQCDSVILGVDGAENIIIKWKDGLLNEISNYFTPQGRITSHQFFYDEHGLLVEEKIYMKGGESGSTVKAEDKEPVLVRNYKIVYEPGKGDEDKMYFFMRNWKVNMFFNQKTCDPYVFIYY